MLNTAIDRRGFCAGAWSFPMGIIAHERHAATYYSAYRYPCSGCGCTVDEDGDGMPGRGGCGKCCANHPDVVYIGVYGEYSAIDVVMAVGMDVAEHFIFGSAIPVPLSAVHDMLG